MKTIAKIVKVIMLAIHLVFWGLTVLGLYGKKFTGCKPIGYNETAKNFFANTGYGFVGDTSHPAMLVNAVVDPVNNFVLYDDESTSPGLNNNVDWTLDAYYDWTVEDTRELASGVVYTKYSFVNVPRTMHVVEVDLKSANVEVVGALAGDMIPNPNGNGNYNNGFNLRERLSDVCNRRRAAGEKILYGVNACFFDSNDGISRGFHVENGSGETIRVEVRDVVLNDLPHGEPAAASFQPGTAGVFYVKADFSALEKIDKERDFFPVRTVTGTCSIFSEADGRKIASFPFEFKK